MILIIFNMLALPNKTLLIFE